jgi:hypothetical protein
MVENYKNSLKYNEKSIELSGNKLALFRMLLDIEEKKKKRRRIFKFIRKKLIQRKRKEAFPRKNGKYNELFQDLGKESGNHNNPIE